MGADVDSRSGAPATRTIILAAVIALIAAALLAGMFFLGRASRESDASVQGMLQKQARTDHGYYTTQRVKAVVAARQDVRETWQARTRKDARKAREAGQAAGYQSGSAQGYASGHEQGQQEGQVEGYFEGYDEGLCVDPVTYVYVC